MSNNLAQNISAPDKWLLLSEVAAILRCSVKTVRRLITDGKLRSAKPRGQRLVALADLNVMLQATTH